MTARRLIPLAAVVLLVATGCTTGSDASTGPSGSPSLASPSSGPTASPSTDATASPSSVPTVSPPTGSSPSPSSTAAPSSPASTSASALTPTFPALDVADPSTWLITFKGIGPLVVGDPLATVRQRMEAVYAPTTGGPACVIWDVGPTFTPMVSNTLSESDPLTYASISSDPVVAESTPRTAAGIGLGSTAAEVLAAYPGATEHQDSYGTRNLAITDNGGMYIDFVLPEGVVTVVVVLASPVAPDEYCG